MSLPEGECRYCLRIHDLTGYTVIAFTGSREKHWTDAGYARMKGLVARVVYHLREKHGDARLFIKVGDANGVDREVRQSCDELAICHGVERADWKHQGSFAGHERNTRVIDGADVLIAICRPGERLTAGTGNCVYQAEQRGITVHEWRGSWLR